MAFGGQPRNSAGKMDLFGNAQHHLIAHDPIAC
jgi:hypothetical protein